MELAHRRRAADGGDAAGKRVPGVRRLPGTISSYLGDQGGEARSVARSRASAPLLLPGIGRRSCGQRRFEAAVDGSVDLASKQTPNGVKTVRGEG